MPKKFLLPLLLCLSAHSPSAAPLKPSGPAMAPPAAHVPSLDTARVRKLYQDGEFDQSIGILESALKENRVVDHSDSVFVFKHLGVMYAANESTRERGKYFMLQLLMLEPTARIMDMYASDMIYMIFKNIQEEFATSHAKYLHAQSLVEGNRTDQTKSPETPRPAREPVRKESHAAYYWAGATIVVVGIGAAIYVLANDKAPQTSTHQVE